MREWSKLPDGWRFTGPDGSTAAVTLPHTWNAQDGQDGGNDYWRGCCLYGRDFACPVYDPTAQQVWLQFEGVNASAEVDVNGRTVAVHDGGYSTFRAEVTQLLQATNRLTVKVDNSINGRAYPLHGVSRHQDRKGLGNAITRAMHDEDMALIREMGCNTVRLAHYQHDQYFYDLCDENGMVVWAEIPYISEHMPAGRQNTISQMKELITQNYNHPCICVWGVSNEITISTKDNADMLDNHHLLNDLCHSMDPTRPTTLACYAVCGPFNKVAHITDVVSWNLYLGWYVPGLFLNDLWCRIFHLFYPNRALGYSEYGAEVMPNLHSAHPRRGDHTEEYQCIYHEYMLGFFRRDGRMWATHVWNMFDFAADARDQGGEIPANASTYMIYQEGIYIGYKYYETRYEDVAMGTGNAGAFDYDSVVAFPFGYGLSYTMFAYSDFDVNYLENDDLYEVTVRVTNTGKMTVATDAHNAVENILAAKGYGNGAAGTEKQDEAADLYNAGPLTCCWTQAELDTTTYATSQNGTAITSQLSSADPNLNESCGEEAVWLSHSDWEGTFPKETVKLALSEALIADLQDVQYDPADYEPQIMPRLGAQNGLTLFDMIGKDYDDPDWDTLLDQLTFDEMVSMIGDSFHWRMPATSVQAPGTRDENGPQGLTASLLGSGKTQLSSTAFTSEDVMAASILVLYCLTPVIPDTMM